MRLSLVVPAHNEARRLEQTLRAYRRALGDEAEIIVVPNACTDDTVGVARRAAAELGGIALVVVAERVGKGGAVREGFRHSSGDLVGFVDADLATSPEDLRRVVDAAERCGVAIGSRWAPGSHVAGRTVGRGVASRVFAWLVRVLLRLPFRDTQCGVKILQRRFLPAYLAEARVRDLAFDVELLLLLREAGATIEEVPTAWTAQPDSAALGSLSGFVGHGARMARTILALWWRRVGRTRRRAVARA